MQHWASSSCGLFIRAPLGTQMCKMSWNKLAGNYIISWERPKKWKFGDFHHKLEGRYDIQYREVGFIVESVIPSVPLCNSRLTEIIYLSDHTTPQSIYIMPLLGLNLSHFCILRASSIICRSLSTLYVSTSRASGRTGRPELPSTMFGVLLNCYCRLSALKCPRNFMERKNKCCNDPYLLFLFFVRSPPHTMCWTNPTHPSRHNRQSSRVNMEYLCGQGWILSDTTKKRSNTEDFIQGKLMVQTVWNMRYL